MEEAKRLYKLPRSPATASSSDYAAALAAAHAETSASSELSTDTTDSTTLGQGVVPLHTGIGSGQAEVVKKARPHGLSLGDLGRKQSWNQQDMKHIASAGLLGKVDGDAGYASGEEEKK